MADLILGPKQNVWLYYDPARQAWTTAVTPHKSGGLGSGLNGGAAETITGNWIFSGNIQFTNADTNEFAIDANNTILRTGVHFSGWVSPAALASGTTDNYNPSSLQDVFGLRLTPNAAGSTLGGLMEHATEEGQLHVLCNIHATANLTIAHEAGTSTAANRFLTATGADRVIGPRGYIVVWHEGTSNRWREIAFSSTDASLSRTANESITGQWTFSGIDRLGLNLLDTNESHALGIVVGSDLTAARVLTVTPGDADRTVTISGNATISQDYSATGTPGFNTVGISDSDASHFLRLETTSNLTADRQLTLVPGDVARTITLSGNPTLADWFDQSVKVAATPTFGATTITGLLTISGAAAGQIAFPASQNASADANTLDDYEEGTWTPVLGGSGGTSGQTYNTQVGGYTKIGNIVYVDFRIILTALGTVSGDAQIQGLPFQSDSATGNQVGILQFTNLATNWITLLGQTAGATTNATVYGSSAAATGLTILNPATDFGNTTTMRGSFIFKVA